MATRDNTVQAAQETARLGISTVVEGVATGIIEIGAATPLLASLCVALLKAKEIVDGASRNKEELQALCDQCETLTLLVINKAKASNTSTIDVSALRECTDELSVVAGRPRDQGCCARLARFRDLADIQELRARIDTDIQSLTPAGVGNIGEQIEEILARLQPRPKLAPVPKNAPATKLWHVVRDGVVDRVCEKLGGDGGPAVAALTGLSGAGKTTDAAAMVGERGDRVRALFPDGVVWLRVGKGAGAPDRVPRLMLKLAKRLHEDVMNGGVDAPGLGEDGGSYVNKIVSQKSLRCLVVADDVREASVVQKLRETGMWVLLTTRFLEMVEPTERVVVDKLTETEAEDVLRRAAELPPGERLCDAAMNVLKICGHVAMDTAFVGSWIRHVETKGKEDAWARAVGSIEAQGGGAGVERDVNRLAILRAGFQFIGTEDHLAKQLYAELAVFPDGHAFGESDVAVLLDDRGVARKAISTLERWGVLQSDASEKYRMHDAHVGFAREQLMGWDTIRKPAVERWTKHISRLDFAVGVDVYALLRMWRALEEVGGDGWGVTRPYDDQLVQMDASNHSKIFAVHVVADLYELDNKVSEVEPIMRKVLKHGDVHGGDSAEVQMAALYHSWIGLSSQRRDQEDKDIERRLGELGSPGLQLPLPSDGAGFLQISTTFSTYGACMRAAGRSKDAEEWFRKALKARETGGLTASYQTVWVMIELGQLVQQAGRPWDAEPLFRRALEIQEAKLGTDDLSVAVTLHELGQCVLDAGRPGEAEPMLLRALEIKEAKLGPDDVGVASTLHELARSVREAGRPREAEGVFRRALKIREEKLGADHVDVAYTLHEMGRSVREAGRPGEAEPLFQRALEIKEAKLGPDDVDVAYTLHELGLCVREAGRPREAEGVFRRALKIREEKLGADHVDVAYTLHEMARSVREAGRPGEAEALSRRVLEIREAKLGADDVDVAYTLHELGLCVREAGRPGDAEALIWRALNIMKAKLGADHVDVAILLQDLGRCVRQVGRPGEAEGLFWRALEIREDKLGADHVDVAITLRELGRCVLEAGRLSKAEALFRRALEIMEARLRADDHQIATVLHVLGLCVLEVGRLGEAEALLRRALAIEEARLRAENSQIAAVLHVLGLCVREAGRPGEAEALFRRALKIREVKRGADAVQVAYTLHELGRCAREAGRLGEAEALSRRALEIREAKLGADDLQRNRTHSEDVADRLEDLCQMLARLHSRLGADSLPMGKDIWEKHVLPYTDFPGLCQYLLVNRALNECVNSHLPNLVVRPEEGQGWTVPMDELKLAPRELDDPPKLVAAGSGVSIEGPENGLQRLNALLVPAPMFLEVDSNTYISLSPVLRCRWRGRDSKGPWVVRFSMVDIGGFDHNFSKLVSVLRRPTASSDGKWEMLDRVDDVDEASGGEETVSFVVTHFSDLIAVIEKATASDKSKGYIINPIRYKFLRPASKTVLVHNASKERLEYLQYWPYDMRTSTTAELQVLGSGGAGGAEYSVRDPKEDIGEGFFMPWPRQPNTGTYANPLPEPTKLNTRIMGWELHLVVYIESDSGNTDVLVRFQTKARRCVILLEGVELIRVVKPETKARVRQALGV